MGCGATKQGPSQSDEVSFPAVHKGKTYIVTLTEKQKLFLHCVGGIAKYRIWL